MVVRRCARNERPAVLRLITAAYAEFAEPWGAVSLATALGNLARVVEGAGPEQLLVAEADGELAGTVTYYAPVHPDYDRVPDDWAVIRALGVDPGWRGHGIARLITRVCLERAVADGATTVGLHTAEEMLAARRLYEDLGFTVEHDFPHLGRRFLVYALDVSRWEGGSTRRS